MRKGQAKSLILSVEFKRKDGDFSFIRKWEVKDNTHAFWYMKVRPGIHIDFEPVGYTLTEGSFVK